MYYASDGKHGQWISVTVPLQNGKFLFNGVSRVPAIVYLTYNNNTKTAFYVEPGQKLKITGDNTDPRTWSISGNKIDEDLSQWRKGLAEKAGADYPAEVERYVKENPDSPVSALLLLTEYPRQTRPKEFVTLWNSLEDKAKPVTMAELSGAPDFVSGSLFELNANGKIKYNGDKSRLKSLALRRPGGTADTLYFNTGNPALLYFYRRGNNTQKEIADTLKALRRQFPDSTKARIATIAMEADSINWRAAVIFDSIPKVMDAWMPLGVADRRAMMLGVARTPYFLVVDSLGKPVYRGSDHGSAAQSFRKYLQRHAD